MVKRLSRILLCFTVHKDKVLQPEKTIIVTFLFLDCFSLIQLLERIHFTAQLSKVSGVDSGKKSVCVMATSNSSCACKLTGEE